MIPGQKVVCVDDSIKIEQIFSIANSFQNWVKKGEEYTVRAILDNDDIVPGILLEEVSNTPIYIKLIDRVQEPAFGAFRFRELEEYVEKEEVLDSIEKIVEEINKL
jgi:hypothetical protein